MNSLNKVKLTSQTAWQTEKQINDNFSAIETAIDEEIPTKTSDLTNDGDGNSYQVHSGYTSFSSTSDYVGYYVLVGTTYTKVTTTNKDSLSITAGTTIAYELSPFATESYVDINGGKIDSISVNNVAQTIDANKNVDITVPTSDSDLTNDRYVRYDTNSQGLNNTQKGNVRTNIDAAPSKPDGTNDLFDNNKISTTYLPDQILGQLLYGGTVTGGGTATLTPNAKARLGTLDNSITLKNNTTAITGYAANDGIYYIASSDGNFANLGLLVGDWLISVGTAWKKIDNTDAVTGVKGDAESSYRIGNINITAENVGAMSTTNPTGTGSLSMNRKANTTVGDYSVTEGDDGTASGSYSHAEGNSTKASGNASHAEGSSTTASGNQAHAEGISAVASGNHAHAEGGNTTASGLCSHAEGELTTASGKRSHAEGLYTIAQRANQHVFGKYNIPDTDGADETYSGTYMEMAGNGTADNARSNARTLDWSGNEVLAGTIQATGFKTASGTSSQFLKADGSVDNNSYMLATAIEDISFTASDAGWGSLDSNGFYTLTITSAKKPFAVYNSSGEQVLAGLKSDGTYVYVITDTKFAGIVSVR